MSPMTAEYYQHDLDAAYLRGKAEGRQEVLALREARADVLSWAPMLRHLRDSLRKGAENIDAALVAIEYDPQPDCPVCGQPLGGSFPTCAGCQLVEALKGDLVEAHAVPPTANKE